MILSPPRSSLPRTAALLLALAVSGCGQRDGSPVPGSGTMVGTGVGPGAGPGSGTAGSPGASGDPNASGNPAGSAAATTASTGATGATGAAPGGSTTCASPTSPAPPACTLARTVVVSASFRPGSSHPVVTSVVRTGPDGPIESAEVWNSASGRFLHTLTKGLEPRGSLRAAWTADGRRVAIAGVGDSRFGFRIYDTTDFRPVFEDPDAHSHFPCAVEIDPGQARIAMTTLLGVAAIHDLETGSLLASLVTTPLRAAGHVCSMLQWSGDGKAIQVEGLRESEGLRSVPRRPRRDPRPSIPTEQDLVALQLAPRGDLAAFLDKRGNIGLFSGSGTVFVRSLPAGRGVPPSRDPATVPVRALSWRPDAGAIATWDHTGKIRVWDVAKAGILREMRARGPRFEGPPDPEVEDARLVWAPGGQSFAFWSGERAELWTVEDGRQRLDPTDLPKPESPGIPGMQFSPDGALLAAGTAVWDAKTGRIVRRLPATFDQWVSAGAFVSLAADPRTPSPLRIVRVSDGTVLIFERLGDDSSPTLLAHTKQSVFQGPTELASCALPPPPDPVDAGPPAAPPPLPLEPRPTLLADFWAGRPVDRTCPVR